MAVLAQALSLPAVHGMRYAPFGVMVRKEWLFAKGGRPVIYQPEVEFDHLGESHRFRHVRYEPANGHDFTWEREWRIRTEALEITPPEVTFVVPTRTWEERMQDSHAGRLRLGLWFDSDFAQAISRPPWHFVVLEDLGMQIDLS